MVDATQQNGVTPNQQGLTEELFLLGHPLFFRNHNGVQLMAVYAAKPFDDDGTLLIYGATSREMHSRRYVNEPYAKRFFQLVAERHKFC